MKQGRIIIISGPSGVGKGTVVKELLCRRPDTELSVSVTTRDPRPGEIAGVHYHYLNDATFEEMIRENKLLEHAGYSGRYYGTPSEPVDRAVAEGRDMLLEIEVKGALQVMNNRPEAISIFIGPPSFEELRHRLENRGDTKDIERRLEIALEECKLAEKYRYTVINRTVERAVDEIEAILTAESCRSEYQKIQL